VCFQCFGRLQVREKEISLCKWSGGTAQFRALDARAGPASNVRVVYFSGSQFHNGFAAVRDDVRPILHYSAVTKEWMTEWPCIANNKTIQTRQKSYSELVLTCYFPNCTKPW